ncbi:M23 family metallopeptidase [Leptospira idonii]|uniref:M23 family metallopeptidase n=2 Tax=Leptospira idonii TaxID=1193500 RepID=A0A4R9M3D5_9LEPT|nr:M23 family metallopeptidase [Leptospira idonii]
MKSVFFPILFLIVTLSLPAESKDVAKKKKEPVSSSSNYFVKKDEKNFSLVLEARRFGRGEAVFFRLTPKNKKWINESFKAFWMGKEIFLTKQGDSFISFFGISPDTAPGPMTLEIQSKILFVKRGTKQYQIILEPTKFQVIKKQSIVVDNKFVVKELPKETLDFIKECKEAKEAAFGKISGLQFSDQFRNPLESIYITSKFYVRRDYNNKIGRPHGGVDFRGKIGTPIFAIQDGTVVLARKMYYEGNFTILDHGNKIFSFYMHQDEIGVKVGDKVKKGQEIGKVGTTGMSTGPHLHLGAKIADTLIDPLSLIALSEITEPK